MYHTIQLSSCVSVQGMLVEALGNGDIVISDGLRTYKGRPLSPIAPAFIAAQSNPRPGLGLRG